MQMLIGGRENSSADDRWIPVVNPANGEEIDRVPEGTIYEVEAAVQAAESSMRSWSAKTPRERGEILHRGAAVVRERRHDLARLLTSEQGKPVRDAIDEVRGFANILEFFAGISGSMQGDFIRLGKSGDCIVSYEPVGICGAIIPWNMPVIIMGWKIAPALVAGNALVFKPASQAPLTCLTIARVLEEAGLPPGLLNVVTGSGEIVGEAIVRHPAIRKISFTGDIETGQRISELAASQLKEIHLELGGSDPMVVWKDADLQKAVDGAIRGRFYNAGQTCTAVKRLYVHQEIADQFISLLTRKVETIRVGNGSDPGVDMGPLSGNVQLERIVSLVGKIRDQNQGRIIAGGSRLTGPGFDRGYFYKPTVVTDVAPGSPLLNEEVFGPVLPVAPVMDLESAIALANSTRFGLGASIWTRDISVVKEFFSGVQAGVIWVNRHLTLPPEVPFGGTKSSGIGRENGLQAYRSFSRTKSVFINW